MQVLTFSLLQSMGKFQECQLKATKCRNDYLMTLAATNTTLQKYFKQDVMSLIDVSSYSIVFSEKHTNIIAGKLWNSPLKYPVVMTA